MMRDLYFKNVRLHWKEAWKQEAFRLQLMVFLVLAISFGFFFPFFFDYVEAREGKILSDPLLNLIPARESSWIVFLFLYTGIILGIRCNLLKPKNFLIGLEIYCF